MAHEVTLTGWEKGLKKVALIKAIKEHGHLYSLNEASDLVDSLLSNNEVAIFCKNLRNAQEFVKKASVLGAKTQADIITTVQIS